GIHLPPHLPPATRHVRPHLPPRHRLGPGLPPPDRPQRPLQLRATWVPKNLRPLRCPHELRLRRPRAQPRRRLALQRRPGRIASPSPRPRDQRSDLPRPRIDLNVARATRPCLPLPKKLASGRPCRSPEHGQTMNPHLIEGTVTLCLI